MYDVLITGGEVIDGRGGPRRRGDVAITGDRITAVGDLAGSNAARIIDATGQVVTPGFVDVHTHYDVQGFWDTTLSPSPLHGVTTAIGGNCGFTVAPLTDTSATYLMRMLARVEGMPLASLEVGVPWNWRTTGEYLDALDGTLAINTAFSVGHCALRKAVMDDVHRAATADEVQRMAALLRDGLAAGAIGFSSTWSETHTDAEGYPVPSRFAEHDELVALAAVCGEFEGTSIEFLPTSGRFADRHVDVMVAMSVAAGRPVNWNVIVPDARSLPRWQEKLTVSDRAREQGGKVVGLVVPFMPPPRFSFLSGFIFDGLPGWDKPMTLPPAEKLALLADPAERRRLHELAQGPSNFRYLADWGRWTIVETVHPDNAGYLGRTVAEIAAEEDRQPVDVLFDIVVADELRTTLEARSAAATAEAPEDWQARLALWRDARTVIGASDAGAHLDMLSTFAYSTTLLGRAVREHGLLTLEEAVEALTSTPADLYGLRDRGRLVAGAHADIVVFDPATVGTGEVSTRFDLPAGAGRLYAEADGVSHVLVNGVEIVDHGRFTDARPGTMLRSGTHTATPALA